MSSARGKPMQGDKDGLDSGIQNRNIPTNSNPWLQVGVERSVPQVEEGYQNFLVSVVPQEVEKPKISHLGNSLNGSGMGDSRSHCSKPNFRQNKGRYRKWKLH